MKVVRIISSELQTNSYLILSKKPALIDTGTNTEKILENIQQNLKSKKLHYIILTHFHYDHTQVTKEIKKEISGRVLIHELDADYLDLKISKKLKHNEILDLDDVKLKVIHTPGHSPGSICLYEPISNSLFSGDTVFPHGSFGRTDLSGGDINQIVKSLESLTRFNVKALYPGHGEVTKDNVKEQIKESLEIAKLYLKTYTSQAQPQ